MQPQLTWARDTNTPILTYACKCGNRTVGEVAWAYSRPKGDDRCYTARCFLPGMKAALGAFVNEEEACQIVERAARSWFETLVLIESDHAGEGETA